MTASRRTETDLLLSHLDDQRRHILGMLDGLSEEDLRRPVLPTGWSCLGLVRHLTLDDERFWFRCVVAAEAEAIRGLDEVDDAWHVDADIPAETIIDRYRQEIERSNAVIAATPLETPPAWWPADLHGDWGLDDLRDIILHMIAETACHAGHLDAARELIDGRTWLIMPS